MEDGHPGNQATGDPTVPYTVVVLGAGCSRGLGLPLLRGFIDEALDRRANDGQGDSLFPGWLKDIQAFIGQVKSSAAYVRSDLLNIEELYGLADLERDLTDADDDAPCSKALTALRAVMLEIFARAGEELVDPHYQLPRDSMGIRRVRQESSTFDAAVREHGTKHASLVAYLSLAAHRDADGSHPLLVQFNWDLALDRALYAAFMKASNSSADERLLCLDEDGLAAWGRFRDDGFYDIGWQGDAQDGERKLFPWTCTPNPDQRVRSCKYRMFPMVSKPHGSLNWFTNHDEDNLIKRMSSLAQLSGKTFLEQRVVTGVGGNGWRDNFEAIRRGMEIVPPTWRKSANSLLFRAQWKEVLGALKTCRRIVFIGYSMPTTDLYFRHFLSLALASNNRVPNVYVWNPSIFEMSPERESYLTTFAPLAQEGRLWGIRGKFGDPALLDLDRAVQAAERLGQHGSPAS